MRDRVTFQRGKVLARSLRPPGVDGSTGSAPRAVRVAAGAEPHQVLQDVVDRLVEETVLGL
jgi:hypothetical protein